MENKEQILEQLEKYKEEYKKNEHLEEAKYVETRKILENREGYVYYSEFNWGVEDFIVSFLKKYDIDYVIEEIPQGRDGSRVLADRYIIIYL